MKRFLSMFLTLTMVMGMFTLAIPVNAAEDDGLTYTEVATLEQFETALAAKANIKLTADITLKQNVKYKLYTGTTLNGNGHTIYIPTMTANNAVISWSVGTTDVTTIKNVNFGSAEMPFTHKNSTVDQSASLTTDLSAGYPVAWENVNIYFKTRHTVSTNTGAIMSKLSGTMTFDNVNVFADIENVGNNTGAWFAQVSGTGVVVMNNCNTYGTVYNKTSNAAGFVSQMNGSLTMNDCTNYANATISSSAGDNLSPAGFVSYATAAVKKLELNRCVNYGNMTGKVQVGGFLGKFTASSTVGSIVLNDCINYGNVKAFNGNANGFSAQVANVTYNRCINFGTCTGYNAAGFSGNAAIIANNCMNAGLIVGERQMGSNACAGGFMAYGGNGTLTNCVNIGEVRLVSGKTYGAGNFSSFVASDKTLTLNNCYAFGRVYSHNGTLDGVMVGTGAAGTVTSTNTKYIDFGNSSTAKLGDGTTKATEAEAPALIKSLLGIDVIWGEGGNLVVATPAIRGVQSTAPANGLQSIRVIATMAKARNAIKTVGFTIKYTQDGVDFGTKEYNTNKVMASVNNQLDGASETITARQMAGAYIFTAEIRDVPVSSTVTLEVTPWISDGTNTYLGETKTITYTNGIYTEAKEQMANTTSDTVTAITGSPLPQKVNTALYQKSVLFCGDSICYGTNDNGVYAPSRSWAGRIGYIHDMDYVNAGISSAGVSDYRKAYSIIVDQMAKHSDRDFDFVVLHGGVNDAWGTSGVDNGNPTPVGTITPAGTTTFDRNTFAGGLENLLYQTKLTYPNAKIGYIINFYAPNCTSGTVKEMSAYVDMTKLICDKYDIPYIDLYNNAELSEKLQVNAQLAADYQAYIPDNIHPNAGGYDFIYPYIEAWMETELAGGEASSPAAATLKLGGADISNYTIVYAPATELANASATGVWRTEYDSARVTAERLAAMIKAKFGVQLNVISQAIAPETPYEILVGNTTRAASTNAKVPSLTTDQYFVGMVGTKLVIKGGAAGTLWHAVDELATYFDSTVDQNLYALQFQYAVTGTYYLERIAFLGDSITNGALTSASVNKDGQFNPFGYGMQVARMDWKECVARPYGSPGTELTKYMNIALWKTFLTESAAANYDVVVIALGINDANVADKSAGGWSASHTTECTTALKNLVAAVAQANPNAEIMIMTCCAHFRVEGNSGGYTAIVSTQTVVDLQKQTAQELKNAGYNVHLYDLYAYTTERMTLSMFDRPDGNDRLHPYDIGHEVLAEGVSKALQMIREGKTDQYLLY